MTTSDPAAGAPPPCPELIEVVTGASEIGRLVAEVERRGRLLADGIKGQR